MAVHLQIRDLPDEIHQTLRQRADTRGLSLRQYALEVLREHCLEPTLDEWLDGLSRLTPVTLPSTSAAEAVTSLGRLKKPPWSMPSLVLDASAAVEPCCEPRPGDERKPLYGDIGVAVPAHFDAEVLSALGRLVRGSELAERLVEPILRELARAPFVRYTLQPLLAPAWGLRHNLAQRDALYVTLARRLGAPLVTADARLARAPALGIAVTLVVSRD